MNSGIKPKVGELDLVFGSRVELGETRGYAGHVQDENRDFVVVNNTGEGVVTHGAALVPEPWLAALVPTPRVNLTRFQIP